MGGGVEQRGLGAGLVVVSCVSGEAAWAVKQSGQTHRGDRRVSHLHPLFPPPTSKRLLCPASTPLHPPTTLLTITGARGDAPLVPRLRGQRGAQDRQQGRVVG